MTPIWKLAVAPAVFLSLSAAPAFAQDAWQEWDANADAGVDMQEYETGMSSSGVFENWDSDGNGSLSQEEFDQGAGENQEAFNERFGENAFGEWDADGNDEVSETEFHESTFGAYDGDSNDIIEEPEFGDLGDDIGDGGFWDV